MRPEAGPSANQSLKTLPSTVPGLRMMGVYDLDLKTPRHLTLAILFVGLIALEIAQGLYRLDKTQQEAEWESLARVERSHGVEAAEIRRRLEEAREHAAYIARIPAVASLLSAPRQTALPASPPDRPPLASEVLPYLVSFRGLDRVRILDLEGRERFRCERIGKGVGVIPRDLLEPEPDFGLLSLVRDTRPGEVVISGISRDSRRVEVPEDERQVVHFGAPVDEGPARVGYAILTVYAAPILNEVRGFAPLPGAFASLVDADGSYIAHADRSLEKMHPGAGSLSRDFPGAGDQILRGSDRATYEEGLLLSQTAHGKNPCWRFVAVVPDAALRKASLPRRSDYIWAVAWIVAVTVALALAGAFLVRMSIREVELREAARYRKQEEEMNRRVQLSERLGSLGLLTAGVAHEINNPLEGIENYLSLLEKEPGEPEKRKRYLEMVRYGFRRIRDIVRDLASFSRPGVESGTADLATVAAQALRMVRYAREMKSVTVELRGLDEPRLVPGDGRRLEQVFINLLLNAGKAMQGNGSITITAAASSSTQGGPETEITVEDSGPGIPEKDLPRIFDPFFTTGDGTGLGLSISYGILRAHGGSIVAENRAEGGARFTLRLPAAALAPPASATPPVSRKPEEPRNAATAHSPSARKIET